MDTDADGEVVKETDPEKRKALVAHSWQDKRIAMKNVCTHCHTENYVEAFYKQYDDFVVNYNEKFAKPGQAIMTVLKEQKLITSRNSMKRSNGHGSICGTTKVAAHVMEHR
jgi:hydroxylamine dehydrogenase